VENRADRSGTENDRASGGLGLAKATGLPDGLSAGIEVFDFAPD
jgi:hypothetical protein